MFSTGKTLNLIPSTEKHRGEEEKVEEEEDKSDLGVGRERGKEEGGAERES